MLELHGLLRTNSSYLLTKASIIFSFPLPFFLPHCTILSQKVVSLQTSPLISLTGLDRAVWEAMLPGMETTSRVSWVKKLESVFGISCVSRILFLWRVMSKWAWLSGKHSYPATAGCLLHCLIGNFGSCPDSHDWVRRCTNNSFETAFVASGVDILIVGVKWKTGVLFPLTNAHLYLDSITGEPNTYNQSQQWKVV